jgi:Bacterial Ig domain
MSVTTFEENKSSLKNRTAAVVRRRKAAVSSASLSMIEPLESRRLLTATMTLVNPDILPGSSRLIFNYIQNPDPTFPNMEHSQQTLEIEDTGNTPLVISSMTLSGPWSFVPSTQTYNNVTVNPGTPLTVTLAFTQRSLPAHSYNETNFTTAPNGGAAITGSLTINSNDATTPSNVVTLAGYWQDQSNNNNEPDLQTITNLVAGYGTTINPTPINDLTQTTSPVYYGSEVVSSSWEAADASEPVSLQQLAAFRTEGNTATVYWYSAAAQQSHELYTDQGNQGQTLLPTLSNGNLAAASFTPGGAFGIRVDNEYSTDSINVANGNTGGGGHHFRFFPLVDSSGNTVPNTYIVAMDYGTIQDENFDFQDNVFVVSNIRPAGTPGTPTGFTATNATDPVLTWNAVSYSPVVYDVYSSTSATGTFTLLTPNGISGTTYTDTSNPSGAVYYQLKAEDNTQNPVTFSVAATASANTGPATKAISLSTYSGVAVTFNPLSSATDASGTIVSATLTATTPNHGGTATVNTANGSITYTPTSSFTGTETFSYTVADSNGIVSAPATVTVTVSAVVAEPPVANNEVVTTLENAPLDIPVLNVDNATTTFNVSSIKFATEPKDGNISLNTSTGVVSYTPAENFVGGDSFTYTVADNNGLTSNTATVNINVGTEISSAKGAAKTLVYTDENGTPVTITISKGVADVFFDGIGTVVSTVKGKTTVAGSSLRARQISLSGTTAASTLTISGGKGKGQVNLGGISDTSPLGSISAATTNLSATGSTKALATGLNTGILSADANLVATPIASAGTLNLAGVKTISLNTASNAVITLGGAGVTSTSVTFAGAVTDTSLTSTVALNAVKARSWVNDNLTTNSESVTLTAPSIKSLTIAGVFDAGLTAGTFGTAKITGAVNDGSWSVTGSAKSITVGAVGTAWGGLSVAGSLGTFAVKGGNLTADVSAASITSLTVAGAIESDITTTGNLGTLRAGQLVDALVDVGSSATSVADATTANAGGATLKSFSLTSKAANTFNDSSVIAGIIDSISTGPVNAANGSTPEGFAAKTIKSAAVTIDGGTLHLSGKTLLSNAALASFLSSKGESLVNFTIDIL